MVNNETPYPVPAWSSLSHIGSGATRFCPRMKAAVSIRSADADDEGKVVELFQAQLDEHDIFAPATALREVTHAVIADPRHGFILLATDGAESVGIAYAAAHLSAEHGGVIGWLEELYVRPDFRGRGVGSALLDEVTARAQALAWRGLELEIVEGHERAVPLYLRHRFQPLTRSRYSRIFPL